MVPSSMLQPDSHQVYLNISFHRVLRNSDIAHLSLSGFMARAGSPPLPGWEISGLSEQNPDTSFVNPWVFYHPRGFIFFFSLWHCFGVPYLLCFTLSLRKSLLWFLLHIHTCIIVFFPFFFLSEKGIVRMMKGIVNMMYMGLRFFDLWYCSVLTQLPWK